MAGSDELSALLAAHAVWLTAFLRGLTACEADAEDAFQEVWLRVLKGGGPSVPKAARGYLAKLARSVVIDRHRRNARLVLSLDAADEADEAGAESVEDSAPRPPERLESRMTHEEVLSAIRALPPGPREVILLRIEAELSFQEIADALAIPLGTALTWMRRGTARLKRTLEEKK